MSLIKNRYNIKSALDLHKIQGYRYDIDPKREPLKKIIEHYNVSPKIQCGLSGCHQWHNDGFLVELENGNFTNVGHICGASFGEKFEAEKTHYMETILRPLLIQVVYDGKKRLESMHLQINALTNAASRLSSRKYEFRKRFPEASKNLDRRASSGSYIVTDSVTRSKTEIEDMLAINPYQNRESLQFRDVEKGRISGMQLFSLNIQEKINREIVNKAQELIDLDMNVQTLKTTVLVQWEVWLSSFNEKFEEAIIYVNKADEFFSEENYKLIASLPLPRHESSMLKKMKTASFDETMTSDELSAIKVKKLNRAERRKLQFNQLSR